MPKTKRKSISRKIVRRVGARARRPAVGAVIPKTMRAAVLARFGGPDAVALKNVAVPEPGPNEVLIRVAAANVGIWDAKTASGEWTEGFKPPVILGADGAGVVVAAGPRVRALKAGDEVFAAAYMNPKGGFHAQYACVGEDSAAPKPRSLTLEQAGAIAATGLTALQGVDKLEIKDGDVVLVFGATGGVGTLAVQFAKLKGARVVATGSSEDKRAYLRSIGADACFDSRKRGAEGLSEAMDAIEARELSGVLALASDDVLRQAILHVAYGGRVVFPNGVEPIPKADPGVDVISYNGEPSRAAFEALTEAVEKYPAFDVHIEKTFDLDDAGRAYERVGRGGLLGRVVLRVDPLLIRERRS